MQSPYCECDDDIIKFLCRFTKTQALHYAGQFNNDHFQKHFDLFCVNNDTGCSPLKCMNLCKNYSCYFQQKVLLKLVF